jgi:hypothetical protein
MIYTDDQEQLIKSAGGVVMQVFEPGELTGKIKSAVDKSSRFLSDSDLERYRPDKNHYLAHLVAMGATEQYGWNRNNDGYKRATLERDHPTFVQYGHYFEEHRNRDPKLAKGEIKFSAYNPVLDRVELFIWGDIKKAAEDFEDARAGKSTSYSMSTKIPYDVCNCCEHKAATIANHCIHMKQSAGLYLPEFQKYAYVDNPHCRFFDISRVKNPADRTAHYLAYRFPDMSQDDLLAKAASASDLRITSTDWAEYEGVQFSEDELEATLDFRKMAQALLQELRYAQAVQAGQAAQGDIKSAFVHQVGSACLPQELFADDLRVLRQVTPAVAAAEFGKRAMVLPYYSAIAYATGRDITEVQGDPVVKSGGALLPMALQMLSGESEGGCNLCGNLHREFLPASNFMCDQDPGNTDVVQSFMDQATKVFGVSEPALRGRVITITIKASAARTQAPQADTTDKQAMFYAQAYGQYLTQALLNIKQAAGLSDKTLLAVAAYAANCSSLD